MHSVTLEPLTALNTYAYQGVYAQLDALIQEETLSSDPWFSEESRSIEEDTKGALKQVYRIVCQQDFFFKMLAVLLVFHAVGLYFLFQ
jgi:hypothetical protein